VINNEYELKIMLTKNEYLMLRKYITTEYLQTNYYFDNEEYVVYTSMNSLRIRQINSKYIITHKHSISNNKKGVIEMVEKNVDIDKNVFTQLINGEKNIAEFINVEFKNLKYIGYLETKRAKLNLENNMPPAELDYNKYNNIIDYELEWEIDENIYNNAINILNKYGINIENHKIEQPKFLRFIRSLNIG